MFIKIKHTTLLPICFELMVTFEVILKSFKGPDDRRLICKNCNMKMLIKIKPTTLLKICFKFMINLKVILKSIKGPDDRRLICKNCMAYSKSLSVLLQYLQISSAAVKSGCESPWPANKLAKKSNLSNSHIR